MGPWGPPLGPLEGGGGGLLIKVLRAQPSQREGMRISPWGGPLGPHGGPFGISAEGRAVGAVGQHGRAARLGGRGSL